MPQPPTTITQPPAPNELLLHDAQARHWLHFRRPLAVFTTRRADKVLPLLSHLAARVETAGLYAAGFLAYEAAPAFDPAQQVQPAAAFPLLWFGLYPPPLPCHLPEPPSPPLNLSWQPSVSEAAYRQAVRAIRRHISAGHTYQVNYSYRLRAPFTGDPWPWFLQLIQAQAPAYGAYLDTGPFAILSASPELFFRLDGPQIIARPMKGTAPRALTWQEDRLQAERLRLSEKDRAENVMIVDMLRNDLGRVATTGTVAVPELFCVEQYPTLWQMTSTVTAQTQAGLPQILQALFPCASITGAPRVRTMDIIRSLEDSPRRIYTGSLGYLAPGRQAQFNVAIRTVLLDRQAQQAEYGVGGGIVWDSTEEGELAETLTKARVLAAPPPSFRLLETMRWTPAGGYFLLERHLQRLAHSAAYFGFHLPSETLRLALAQRAAQLAAGAPPAVRLRLLLARDGTFELQATPYDPAARRLPRRVCLAPHPVDPNDPFLYHKTTRRSLYETALAACPGYDDVLLWNQAGELTESCLANLLVELDGQRLTPPLSCGLLPGTYRDHLLAQGLVREAVVRLADLPRCTGLWLLNSVRGAEQALLKPPNL